MVRNECCIRRSVKNRKNTFLKALTISGIIILISLILSNIAIFIVVEKNEDVDIITGIMTTFSYFFENWYAVDEYCYCYYSYNRSIHNIPDYDLSSSFNVVAEDGVIQKNLSMKNQHNAPTKF